MKTEAPRPCICALGLADPRKPEASNDTHEALVPIWLCPAHEDSEAARMEREALRRAGEDG